MQSRKKQKSGRATQGHHGAEGGRGHKKPLSQDSDSGVPQRDWAAANANKAASRIAAQAIQPSRDFLAVHQITVAAQAAGWPSRSAFEAAMHLRIHGVTVAEAQALFDQAARVTQ